MIIQAVVPLVGDRPPVVPVGQVTETRFFGYYSGIAA